MERWFGSRDELVAFLRRLGIPDPEELIGRLEEEGERNAYLTMGSRVYSVYVKDDKVTIMYIGDEYSWCGGPNCILSSVTVKIPPSTKCTPTPYGYAVTWEDGIVTQICEDERCEKCRAVDTHIDNL